MSTWPQWVYLELGAVGIGIGLAQHGQPREPHHFGVDFFASAIVWFLLYKGGFFAPLGW